MNNKNLLLVFLAFLLCNSVQANKIGLQTAETVAVNFYKLNSAVAKSSNQTGATLVYTRYELDNTVDYYVFDIAPKGFVIVTADDNIEPVIAYSTESDFHLDFDKTGVKDWMSTAAKKIAFGLSQQTKADARIANLWSSYQAGSKPAIAKANPVNPLLTTTWNQEPYYNQLCPYNSADEQQCVTGCVATAMAQIMKFWNFPPTGTGSYSYNDNTPSYSHDYGPQSADFATTTYSWPTMSNAVSSSNTAVATLMYQCGVAVAMDYGDDKQGGSGAAVLQAEAGFGRPCAQRAFTTYFFYNASTMQGVAAASYTSAQWISLLEAELSAGRPVQYEGQDPGVGGHSWVCDGNDANDMFHMNWGWGGYENGYYSLSGLSVAGVNFSSSEAALIGIEPGTYVAPCNAPEGLTASVITTSATLSWPAISGATAYNLQYHITGDTGWVAVANISNATYSLTGLNACSAYEYKVQTICSGGTSAFSTTVPFSTMGCLLSYCTSGAINITHGFIQNVNIGSINNNGVDAKGYNSYTGISTNLEQGSANVITLTPGFTDSTYTEYWSVYIDYNENGLFDDPGELVASVNGTGAVTATIHVPLAAVPGTAGLRIQMQQGAYQNNSCATFAYGEVQDYSVNILQAPSTAGISNVAAAHFKLYPNPAADHVSVEYDGISDGAVRINVYNLAGQKVISEEANAVSGTNVYSLKVNQLNNGAYLMEIESSGELNRQKFIITK